MEVGLPVPPLVLVGALAAAAVALYAWRRYQVCPHCGRLAPRVLQGWRRCRRCGRQYRPGLRLR